MRIKKDSPAARLIYFWLGLVATFSYRIIIVLNFYEPVFVKVAWYVGTIGFIIYFWNRYHVIKQFDRLIEEQKLVEVCKNVKGVTRDQKKALTYIISTLDTTKAQINYEAIFLLSALALVAGIILDFVV